MSDFTKKFLKRTIEVWQQHYDYPLTLEDAREIAENMIGLFKLLDGLDKKHES